MLSSCPIKLYFIHAVVFHKIVVNNGEIRLDPFLQFYTHTLQNFANYTYKDMRDEFVSSLHLKIGLFFANANLKRIIWDNIFRPPMNITNELKEISDRFDEVLVIINETNHLSKKESTVYHRLFEDVNLLSSNLRSFYKVHPYPSYKNDTIRLVEAFPDFGVYLKSIRNLNKYEPNPASFDDCLVALATVQPKAPQPRPELTSPLCNLPENCYYVIRRGTQYGYALSLRILFLLIAKLEMECVIFGRKEDEDLERELCLLAYDEARYIERYGFNAFDLMVENMAFCSMLGHTEFLREDWLMEVTKHEIAGCFSEKYRAIVHKEAAESSIEAGEHCNPHLTGNAIAVLSSGMRWHFDNTEYRSREEMYRVMAEITSNALWPGNCTREFYAPCFA